MSTVHETLTLFNRDFHFKWELPGTWNNLSAWQLRRIVSLQQLGLSKSKFMALCIPLLLNVRKSLVKQFVLRRKINPEYLELTQFLVDDDQYLTRNIIGRYRGLKTVSRWQEMVAKQYFIAESYLDEFRKSKSQEDLDKFLCAFYAPANQDFWKVDEDKNYLLFKKWPMDVKLSILTFYLGARREFQSYGSHAKIFKKGTGESKPVAPQLLKLRSQMAKNDLTKTKEIDAILLPELLFQLNKDIEDAEQRTQQLSRGN